MTLLGSVFLLILCFAVIFFGARSCVAAQEATQIRKYVTSADSTLSDSANAGNEELQATVAAALEDPASLDTAAVDRAADATQKGYREALRNQEVPPEFEDAHHYMVSALGIRAAATGDLAEAAEGGSEEFGEVLPAAVEDYKLSDTIVLNHYLPASEEALGESGRRGDQNYLYEPRPFMDYEALGLSTRARDDSDQDASAPEDPSAPRDVSVFGLAVAGRPLVQGGNVILTGSDELTFTVTLTNGAEVAETGVPVEVVLNTRAERQAIPATVERMEPGGQATVEVRGFKPGEFDETAEVSVKAGPVKYEQNEADNVLTGTVTFGL
ncbi:MAG: ATPase involved in DNA repair [uncultured Rubrobacteraceae bacterium]|uniref:ATPase involved in DNA repair n=1 Tax=uncultured Rubrobacteraceae bacterium TaxID=349277 RepID=A0A6J4Q319_9ACTN|nr:MAG: ATPase involved in DNA repair [uncultured Rubrobacteraceae bacterium]